MCADPASASELLLRSSLKLFNMKQPVSAEKQTDALQEVKPAADTWVGLDVLNGMRDPTITPEHASLHSTHVPYDAPFEGQLPGTWHESPI